jgi:LemA protein
MRAITVVKGRGRRTVGVAVVVAALVVAYGIHVHNRVARSEEEVLAAWRQIRIVEQRRSDLIPQLVNVTEAYAMHERQVLLQLADSRSRYLERAARPEGAKYLAALDQASVDGLGCG